MMKSRATRKHSASSLAVWRPSSVVAIIVVIVVVAATRTTTTNNSNYCLGIVSGFVSSPRRNPKVLPTTGRSFPLPFSASITRKQQQQQQQQQQQYYGSSTKLSVVEELAFGQIVGSTTSLMTHGMTSSLFLKVLLNPVLLFALCFRLGAALAVIGQPRLPQDASDSDHTVALYPVGSKILRLPVHTSGARIRLFYPCTTHSTTSSNSTITNNTIEEEANANYCTDGRATSDGMAGLVGFRQVGLSFLLAHLANTETARSGCYDTAPIMTHTTTGTGATTPPLFEKDTYRNDTSSCPTTNHEPEYEPHPAQPPQRVIFPLLVYSHGYGGNMDMGTYFLRGLAARGMIVAAIEHTDGTASSTTRRVVHTTRTPPEEGRNNNTNGNEDEEEEDTPEHEEQRFEFNPALHSRSDSLTIRSNELVQAVEYVVPYLFLDDVVVGNILLGGHSYGCPTAILAAQKMMMPTKERTDRGNHTSNNNSNSNSSSSSSPRISGLLLHDPALGMSANMIQLPPSVPTISYTSDEYNAAGIACGNRTYHVEGAMHGNFVDAPFWAPLWIMRFLSVVIPICGPADPSAIHQQLARSAMAFATDPITALTMEPTTTEQQQKQNNDNTKHDDDDDDDNDDDLRRNRFNVVEQSLFERIQ